MLGDPKVVSNAFGEKCHPQQSVAKRNPKQWRLGLFELPQLRLLSRAAGVSGGWGAAQSGTVAFKGRFACNNYGIVLRLESTRGEH